MKEYQLVISEQGGKNRFWAYYSPANTPPRYRLGADVVVGQTIKEVIAKAKKIAPEDGKVVYTYLDRK